MSSGSRSSSTGAARGELKPTLGLVGITINAMALIAPGAFLWVTFQSQSPSRDSAFSMWPAIALATVIALLTASCYATLSRAYPEAGAGSSYFYAEAAILEKEEHKHFRLARLAKFITGWAAHLYYWVYPGVMVAFMGTLIVFIGQQFINPDFAKDPKWQIIICITFAFAVGTIALIGVTGSTLVNVIINIVQIVSLVGFGLLAIAYRLGHPQAAYEHANAVSVFVPHSVDGLIFQSTIAILLVVGFESATALAGEAINPHRDIPRGVILSLVIQACICYFFEYFAANFFVNKSYQGAVKVMKDAAGNIVKDASGAPTYDNSTFTLLDPTKTFTDIGQAISTKADGIDQSFAGGTILQGYDAAGASSAPIGDMAKIIGDAVFSGHGTQLELLLAISVVMALIGTALSCLATGVRVSYAMGADRELPEVFGFLHGRFNTPMWGIVILTFFSAAIGSYGVLNANNLTQVALISNIGTFLLYGMTCGVTLIASLEHLLGDDTNVFQSKVIPFLGLLLNFLMLLGVIYYAVFATVATPDSKRNALIAICVSVAFFVGGFAYLIVRSLTTGQPIFLPADTAHPRRERVRAGR